MEQTFMHSNKCNMSIRMKISEFVVVYSCLYSRKTIKSFRNFLLSFVSFYVMASGLFCSSESRFVML